jgi:transcriptional regulator with XRE-family HTH domain
MQNNDDTSKEDKYTQPLGKVLKGWCAEPARKWQAKQAAFEFGVKPATWSRWESGDRWPEPDELMRLARFIGVPICRFFWDCDQRCPGCVRRSQ